jgi:hypothetical protein
VAPVKDRTAGRVAWSICLLTVALVALTILLDFLGLQHETVSGRSRRLLYLTLAVPTAATGALITARRPRSRIGILMLVAGVTVGADQFAWDYVHYQRARDLLSVHLVGWVGNWIWVVSPATLLFALLIYPDGRLATARVRPLAWLVALWAGLTAAVAALGGGIYNGPPLEHGISLHGAAAQTLQRLMPVLYAIFPVLLLGAAGSLLDRFRRAHGAERQQLKWLAYAGALVAVVWVVPAVGGIAAWKHVADNLVLWSVPLAIGVAVLRYRLYDIDRLVNRTLVYGVLTALLGAVYAAGVFGMGNLLNRAGGESALAVAASTLAVAALFQPARRRVQGLVDRRFNRRRYDAAKTIEAFSVRMREQIDLDTLTAELLAVVDRTVEPTQVSLWLRPSPDSVVEPRRRAASGLLASGPIREGL